MIANDMFTAKIEIDDNKYYGNKKLKNKPV